ncbi:MAG: hypothetical protein HUK05_00480 [Prevotella sp.]|nr:hypothetical protein [Prevotella sp.]
MKQYLIFISLFCAFATSAFAQTFKFGKPTTEEWELKDVSFAPDAEAVVLYKSVDVTYKLSGGFSALGSSGDGSLDDNRIAPSGTNKFINPDNTTMLYDVKVRMKILKDSGAALASMDIITLNEEEDMNVRDEFYEMRFTVLSMVNGKVKKKNVSAANYKDERIDKHYCIRHVRIPGVKAGDIVECQYQLFSSRSTFIYDTQLQECVPVLYSKCRMEIPYILQFNVNKPMIKNVNATVVQGTMYMVSPNNDAQLPKKVATNVFTIEARNLPAYAGEINLQNLSNGEVYCVRTELQDKRYDVKPDVAGPVRHLIIGK